MQAGRTPGPLSWRTLSAIVTAEGSRCVHCGTRRNLVAHHKVPRRLGGLDLLENLEPVCRSCHPRIEQRAAADAELVWERPEAPERPPRRRAPRLPRPY